MLNMTKPDAVGERISFWTVSKKIGAGLVIASLVVGSGVLYFKHGKQAPRFVEGVHYKLLQKPYATKPAQIDDYYWLNCDSCFMFEGELQKFSKSNPNFSVNKIHATSNDLWLDDAKLDTVFRVINRTDLIDPFFAAAIASKGFTKDRSAMNEFLRSNHVDVDQFWGEYSSPSALAKALDRAQNSGAVGIKVVPTFVLDGKYKILLGGLKSNSELTDLVQFLEASQPEGSSGDQR